MQPPQTECRRCKGLGWIQLDVPVDHPKFGKAMPCSCRAEGLQQVRIAKLEQIDGLKPLERTFSLGSTRTADQQAVAAALRALLKEGAGMVTLTGDFGVGKTHLLIATVNEARHAEMAAHYTTMRDLLAYLRQAFNPENRDMSYDQRWELLTTAPVLAIDELDKANATPWALEQFSALVDIRWRQMRTHLTLFAMNVAMETLPGDIQDRLRDARAQVHEMGGRSLRPLMGVAV